MANNLCGICKSLGVERCGTDDYVFALCFPPEKQKIFEQLHKIFGADSIYKILSDEKLIPSQREDAVRSLVYAAEARIRDPISGVFGIILEHQKELETLDDEINSAMNELTPIVRSGKVSLPSYYDLPIPDIGFSTSSSMKSIIEKIESLNEVQKKQLMHLPPSDAQKIMNEMFGKSEDQEKCVGHGVAGKSRSGELSTYAGPSMT